MCVFNESAPNRITSWTLFQEGTVPHMNNDLNSLPKRTSTIVEIYHLIYYASELQTHTQTHRHIQR